MKNGKSPLNTINSKSIKFLNKNNLFHGKGVLKFPDGATYNGEWEAGTYHGKGEYVSKDGKKYKGQFSKGKFLD